MIKIHVVTDLTLEVVGDLAPEPAVRAEIDALWAAAIIERPHLFDGPGLSVVSVDGGCLRVVRTSYRYVMAARRSPRLRQLLQMRTLAVSGVLTCPQGVVLGRRGPEVTQGPGSWELVPSGGVEPCRDGSAPDLRNQILKELGEEVGLGPDQVRVGKPLGMVEDTDSGVIDVVTPLSTDLPVARILEAHQTRGSSEYAELAIMAGPRIRNLLPESKAIMETWLS